MLLLETQLCGILLVMVEVEHAPHLHHPPHPPHPHPPPPQEYLNQENSQPQYSQNSPTCLEIASHVKSCPICSRFYNNDNTIYIIAIVILSIICILLLKRVLDL